MIGRRLLPGLGLLLVPAIAACSIGDVRRAPPDRSSAPPRPAPTAPAPSRPVGFDEVRQVRVDVDRRYDRPFVEFADADHGYALFVAACDNPPPSGGCPGPRLFATVDGGRSWRALRHPRPVAASQQLYAVPGALVLLSEPYGWYTSTDGGATFVHSTGAEPAPLVAARGRFQVVEGRGAVAEWDGASLRPTAAQPSVPGLNTVGHSGDLVVAAGVRDGRPYAALSRDGGRHWASTPVSWRGDEVGVLRVAIAPDGGVWLVGERPDRTGFPALWRLVAGFEWALVRAVGHPAQARSVAPLGAELVAVTSPDGVGVVAGGRYYRVDWPLTGEHHLRVLGDGTIAASGPDDLVLGTGWTANRRWVRVVLDKQP
ncbi:hypothetical protein GCE86_26345 [Micromonospora terminaliae]|uniref:Uncharacterized protein n=1 Tax=Micromonospora terminaliae TaxID=1914461 RepID=A0AAJ2ZAF3_9ACTN|nr:hypothetical protein [Micromonospora terminaliae]NES26025.1 hypothetical protein [Micromonospora terminaliae]QGL50230.1 hypothetical protein GCE86_26345 [Micromonospora terminaliae]